MKKSLWIVLALSTILAMFIIAGCQAVAPVTSPTVAPTTAPTTVPVSACPSAVTTTTIVELYSGYSASASYSPDGYDETFEVRITFDKIVNLYSLSPSYWKLAVTRVVPYNQLLGGLAYVAKTHTAALVPTVTFVEQSTNLKTVILYATVAEKPLLTTSGLWYFLGLICSETDYNNYILTANANVAIPYTYTASTTKYADVVAWAYSGPTIYNELGVACPDLCGLTGEECCELPICTTCTNCPIGAAIGTCQ
ncbi:MAG: hypothetical protein NTX88_11790 [Candidatus Atribacteria bacterium]|nr:hypothetical protein [Candidatus Atribacteria bacterium]